MINLKDNSEKDKYILELFQTSPKEAFRLLFDAYHMKLCIYAVQLTDSFEMAEDIVQDFFIYFCSFSNNNLFRSSCSSSSIDSSGIPISMPESSSIDKDHADPHRG